jgi:hypothetical protein
VIEEGAAECTLKEVVAKHEFAGEIPQAQFVMGIGVVAHGEGAGIGPGDEHVVLAAVDLHLVLIEHMP